jgi:hypothetical protein
MLHLLLLLLQDAAWTGPLEASTPGNVFLLLKASDFVDYDLHHAYEKCSGATTGCVLRDSKGGNVGGGRIGGGVHSPASHLGSGIPGGVHLVLRSWCNLLRGMEFRCFVVRRKLVGKMSAPLLRFV